MKRFAAAAVVLSLMVHGRTIAEVAYPSLNWLGQHVPSQADAPFDWAGVWADDDGQVLVLARNLPQSRIRLLCTRPAPAGASQTFLPIVVPILPF